MKQIEKLLRLSNEAEVRYVIIGATAFAAHGWDAEDLRELEALKERGTGNPGTSENET